MIFVAALMVVTSCSNDPMDYPGPEPDLTAQLDPDRQEVADYFESQGLTESQKYAFYFWDFDIFFNPSIGDTVIKGPTSSTVYD